LIQIIEWGIELAEELAASYTLVKRDIHCRGSMWVFQAAVYLKTISSKGIMTASYQE